MVSRTYKTIKMIGSYHAINKEIREIIDEQRKLLK